MEQRKPILELTFPKMKVGEGEAERRASIHVTKLVKKYPAWDHPRNSINMTSVQLHRDLETVNKRVRRARATASIEYKKFDKMWIELQEKEEHLRNSFVYFNTFTIENEEKRSRAAKKLVSDAQLIQARIEMIKDTTEKVNRLAKLKVEFEGVIKEYKIYEDYLNKVISSSAQFKNGNDIISRYDSLTQSKEAIQDKRIAIMDELDIIRNKMMKMTYEKMNKLIEMNCKMVHLTTRYGIAKDLALRMETTVGEVHHSVEQRCQEIDAVKMALHQIYTTLWVRKNIPTLKKCTNFVDQGKFLKVGLHDLLQTLKKVRKEVKKGQQQIVQVVGGTRKLKKKKKQNQDSKSKTKMFVIDMSATKVKSIKSEKFSEEKQDVTAMEPQKSFRLSETKETSN